MFQGFSKESVAYLQELRANNSKVWFEANRGDYDTLYLQPALDLISTIAPVAEALDPPHKAVAKVNKSLRRVNRDTRFSKDKTPYNTSIHIVFWTGDHPNRSAGTHLLLAHDRFGYGAGHWAFEGEGLERYRAAVSDTDARADLQTALEAAHTVGCVIGEPALKKVPRGYDGEGAAADLLRRKGIVAMTRHQEGFDERIFGPDAVPYLTDILQALAPLNRWIHRTVG